MNYSHLKPPEIPGRVQPAMDMSFSDETIKSDMLVLYGDDRFSDVTFKFSSGTDVVHASKLVLASRSQVFLHLLSSGGKWDGLKEIRLDDSVDPQTFGTLMKYLYSSTINVAYECVHSVLLLAHRYQIGQLVDACEGFLCANLSADGLLMNLEVAEICSLQHLKSKCTEKLQQPGLLPRILEADSLRKIALPGLKALLSLEPLPVEEYKLFTAVVKWATAQVGEEMPEIPGPVSREATELCAPLMELIRFPTMNGKELSKLVKPYNIVPPARYVEALEHLADVDSADEDYSSPSPRLARFRSRNPSSLHQTPKRRIEKLTNDLSKYTCQSQYAPQPQTATPSLNPLPAETPASSSPIRTLPTVSQLGQSPWSHPPASYGTPSRYLPRSAGSATAI
eukprot:TRINITY_DN3573_c1_g1_i1.p1 TRINITY_DN3573_c1_g1~~TRINITY_DN3573_c1_g1_i1.p1  ORF type:complete len:395 (+),score=72.10 TRINITY_DN3573_c1_g1_i1:555-1739(+)